MSENDKANILMVDDQPAKLLSYEVILEELGLNLIKATSGRDALDHLLKTDVAVVLMDVSMPELDGFQLAEMIREHPRCQKTAIIFISAVHMTDLDRLKGYERGAVDYISVPVVPELLRAKVSVFAELHRRAHQLQALNRELEQLLAERTEELNLRAEALQRSNGELARKNQELDAVVKTAPDIIFSRQVDGARDYISERFYEFTGAPAGSANGFGWLDYLHADDRERSMAHWTHCVQSGENYECEYRLRGGDGQYRWFRARALPLRDHAGEVLRWYGTCSDIHDSKLLEQSMRDSAAQLEKMVDERTSALRFLSSRLMTMQDDERRRIARELHDGLGQELVAIKMMVNAILQDSPRLAGRVAEVSDLEIDQPHTAFVKDEVTGTGITLDEARVVDVLRNVAAQPLPTERLNFLRNNPTGLVSQVGVFATVVTPPATSASFNVITGKTAVEAVGKELDLTFMKQAYKVGLELTQLLLMAAYIPPASSHFRLAAGVHVPIWPNSIFPCRRVEFDG